MQIEIRSAHVDEFSGQKDNRSFTIRNQLGYISLNGKPYPVEIKVRLDNDQLPYQPGHYEVEESSFYVNRFQQLTLGSLKLTPSAKQKAA